MRKLASRRRLLPAPEPEVVGGWRLVVIFLMLSGLVWLLLKGTGFWGVAMLAALIAIGAVVSFSSNRRLRRLAATREDKSICPFARDFDYRSIDTVIIRAVHVVVSEALDPIVPSFPLRASDRFEADLQLCDDDLDELVEIAAHRSGRSFENLPSNPFSGKVSTVGDLVQFLAHQPAVAPA